MSRLGKTTLETAQGKTKELLQAVQSKFGGVPNIVQGFAQSPAVLEAYLGFSGALGGGRLSPQLREQIALAVAGANDCDYCASAHTAVGKSLGVADGELSQNLRGVSQDDRTRAALQFVHRVTSERGFVTDEDLSAVRAAGFSDEEITEIIGNIALNIFTNYFNHINETEIDFPAVKASAPVTSS